MHKVLVLDANQRSALGAIRSLGRRGLRVIAADHHLPSIGTVSRHAAGAEQYADPTTSPQAFVRDITAIVHRLGIDVVMPMTDTTTMLLVERPDLLAPARLACPSAASYQALTDKGELVKLATGLGVPVPRTLVATTAQQIRAAAADIGYPLVLKPARSRYLKDGRIVATGVRTVRDEADLLACVDNLPWLGDIPCLVQAFVGEHGAGVFAVCGAAGPAAWFAHRRIREKPPSGGVSVLSESAAIDPRLREHAAELLRSARWFGVAMIEFRVAKDGTPYLMEVNGRFWGSLQLAIDSGVDFPWLLYQLASGAQPDDTSGYVIGRRLRWLLGDVDNLLLQVRDSRKRAGAKLRAMLQFIGSCFDFSSRQEVLRWSDPRPGFLEVRQWLAALRK